MSISALWDFLIIGKNIYNSMTKLMMKKKGSLLQMKQAALKFYAY